MIGTPDRALFELKMLRRSETDPRLLHMVLWLGGTAISTLAPAAPLSFAADIQPILEQSCLPCHNATKSEGGLILENPAAMLSGGDNGPAIKINHGLGSLLYETAARKKKPFMPPEANKAKAPALSANQLELLRRWIDEGAIGDARPKQPVAWQQMPGSVVRVDAIAVSSDGQQGAASRGNSVSIYDLVLGRETARFEAHPDIVSTITFSPDNTLLATGSHGEIKLWRLIQTPLKSLPENAGTKAASPDGSRLAEIVEGRGVRLASREGNKEISVLTKDAETIRKVATFESALKGAKFEVGFLEKEQASTKERLTKTKADLDKLQKEYAALGPKSAEMEKAEHEALGKRDVQMMSRDQADNALMSATRTLDEAREAEKAAAAAASALEAALKRATEETRPEAIKALEAAREKSRQTAAERVTAEASMKSAREKFDAQQKSYNEASKTANDAIAARSNAKTAELNIQAFAEFLRQTQKDLEGIESSLAAARSELGKAEAEKASMEKADPNHTLPVAERVAFSEDGEVLFTRHSDSMIRAWNGKTGQPLTGSDLKPTWKLIRTIGDAAKVDSPLSGRVNSIAFSPDGSVFASGSGSPSRSGEIKLWDPNTGALVCEVHKPHKDAVLALDFSRDGKFLASGSADRAVRVWELPEGKLFRNLEAHSNHVLSVSFRDDSRRLASAGADNAIKTWDLQKSDVLNTFSNFTKEVNFLKYLNRGDELLAASGSPALRILKDGGGEVRGKTEGLSKFVTAAAATADGRTQLVGEADGTLRMFNQDGVQLHHWSR